MDGVRLRSSQHYFRVGCKRDRLTGSRTTPPRDLGGVVVFRASLRKGLGPRSNRGLVSARRPVITVLGAWPAKRAVLTAKVSASLVWAGAGVTGSWSLLGGPQGPVANRQPGVIVIVRWTAGEVSAHRVGARHR